ncbi:MAG: iron-sulfur cluster assembly accessory protein [Bdellovibrionales bacterium]|nr:iron-sulfur cluster assembly accessory protein [Bdellovibrionales bacterium]
MIVISPSATSRIQQLKKEDGFSNEAYLRVRIEAGGCSGFNYKLDFDENFNPEESKDKVFESNGTRIVVDPKSLLYILGMTLDYEGGLNGKGFIFSNPNAKEKCSCGTSFAV